MRPYRIFLHWSGCPPSARFPRDYTIEIGPKGEVYYNFPGTTSPKFATWHENTGSIAISADCMGGGARPEGPWPQPPTPKQIESMCLVAAHECLKWGIGVAKVLTHAEIADIDGYGPQTTWERWDWVTLSAKDCKAGKRDGGHRLRARIQWYLNKLHVTKGWKPPKKQAQAPKGPKGGPFLVDVDLDNG